MRSLFGFDMEKNMTRRMRVWNLEIPIEETSLCKARTVIKENVKTWKYENITTANNSSIKWGRWTCAVTYFLKKSWMYELLFRIFSLKYFLDHGLNSWLGILP